MAHNSARKIYMEDELDRWIGQLWAIQMKVTARSQLTIHERIQHLRRCARCQTRDLHQSHLAFSTLLFGHGVYHSGAIRTTEGFVLQRAARKPRPTSGARVRLAWLIKHSVGRAHVLSCDGGQPDDRRARSSSMDDSVSKKCSEKDFVDVADRNDRSHDPKRADGELRDAHNGTDALTDVKWS